MARQTAVMLLDPESLKASMMMLARLRLMAMFISEQHMDEFSAYWRERMPGKAEPSETVNYWAHNDLENTLVLGRKTRI